jgi:hypothetical protein
MLPPPPKRQKVTEHEVRADCPVVQEDPLRDWPRPLELKPDVMTLLKRHTLYTTVGQIPVTVHKMPMVVTGDSDGRFIEKATKNGFDLEELLQEVRISSVLKQIPPSRGSHHFLFVDHFNTVQGVGRRQTEASIYTRYADDCQSFHAAAEAYQTGTLAYPDMMKIQLQLLFALAILHHTAHVIHNDLHGLNVLIQKNKAAKSYEYVVHAKSGIVRRFAFYSRFHVLLMDWGRSVHVPTAPEVDPNEVCGSHGQCMSERTHVVDELVLWGKAQGEAALKQVTTSLIPNEKMRNPKATWYFPCFPQYTSDKAVGVKEDNGCVRCVPSRVDVRSALDVVLDPDGPFPGFRGTFGSDVEADFLTVLYEGDDERDERLPECSEASHWSKPLRYFRE